MKTSLVSSGPVPELVEKYRKDALRLLKEVVGGAQEDPFIVESQKDYVFGSELLKFAKKKKKDLEDLRKKDTQELDRELRARRAAYKPSLDGWGKLETILKRRLGDWVLKLEQQEEEKVRKLAEASIEGDFDRAHQISQTLEDSVEVKGVSKIEKWVVDEVDLQKVPRKYLQLDDDAVAQYIKGFGKDRPKDLPGLTFKKEIQIKGSRRG